MASITLKNLPIQLHRRLKSQAKLNKRSLNQEIILLLDQRTVTARKVDIEAMLAQEKSFSDSLGFTMTPEEIEASIQKGRRV